MELRNVGEGLFIFDGFWKKVDLGRVELLCKITDLTSDVCSTTIYKNELDHAVEAVYSFPLNNVAAYSLEAEIEDRKIVAECRPRAEAKTTYDEAVSSGHMAFMTEQDEHCEDIYQMKLGCIPSQAEVIVRLKYVGIIDAENVESDGTKQSIARFTLPTVLNPRYQPQEVTNRGMFGRMHNGGNMKPYSIQFEADIQMPMTVLDVTSSHDTFGIEWASSDHMNAKVKLTSDFKCDHDLQMVIRMNGTLGSFGICESGNKNGSGILAMDCLMTQWMPDFSQFEHQQELRTELFFVIDQSGSMSGDRIKKAGESLLLFLKSIPIGCRFQIIGFGSTFTTVFSEPVEYNDANVERAMEYQRNLQANMGGTEVLSALREAFRSPLTGAGWYKQIIFLTDGEVGNADEVVGLVRSNVHQARVFTVGIGMGASTYLVEGVARAGRGVCTFIRDNNELRVATMKVLNAALQPRASNVQIEWDVTAETSGGSQSAIEITKVPEEIPPVFSGCFTTVYGLLKLPEGATLKGHITLECDVLQEKQSFRMDIGEMLKQRLVVEGQRDNSNFPLHRLAGKCQLNELSDKHKALLMRKDEEKDETAVKEIVTKMERLSCAINVLCPVTALIGVDPVKGEPVPLPKPTTPPPRPPVCFGRVASGQPVRGGVGSASVMMACAAGRPISGLGFAPAEMACGNGTPLVGSAFGSVSMDCPPPPPPSGKARGSFGQLYGGPCPVPPGPKMRHCAKSALAEKSDETEAAEDDLLTLVKLQSTVGFWKLDKALADTLKLSVDRIKATIPSHWSDSLSSSVDERVWTTLLVLAFMETSFSDRKDEWSLLSRKARLWIETQAKVVTSDLKLINQAYENLFKQAKAVLQSA